MASGQTKAKAGDIVCVCVCGWVVALYNPQHIGTENTFHPTTPACASVCRKKIYSLRCSSPNRKFKCLHFEHQTNCSSTPIPILTSSPIHPPHTRIYTRAQRTKEQRFTYVCLLRISNYIRHRSDSSSNGVAGGTLGAGWALCKVFRCR